MMYGIYWELVDRNDTNAIFRILLSISDQKDICWHVYDLDHLDEYYNALENRILLKNEADVALCRIQDVISICIKAYPISVKELIHGYNNYQTYQSFVSSPCILAFYCFDCVHQEVYSQNKSIIDLIYSSLQRIPTLNMRWINNPEDERTHF